jgi:hypothetical protein
MFSDFFFENPAFCEKMWKMRVQQERPYIIWRMRISRGISNATNTHSQYVILIAFPL